MMYRANWESKSTLNGKKGFSHLIMENFDRRKSLKCILLKILYISCIKAESSNCTFQLKDELHSY